ncbi:glycosyltransferase [Cohnella faecalis]|uniref:Glycosyltransferase n=1 Tax=Cohnella faecalis TaxID=2315694 RepID=A0A398CLS9_9BACL|nr:glycosyltransferase [Cohnella faecalis]RIE04306.1 glycosyltransferase [Cohnella faecalis]
MKISIAMTTYNGQRFVEKQLQSFFNQTRKPDEVIIFDDCSVDNTIKIISEFIHINKLENWKLIVNERNVGWQKNFMNAVEETCGDIVFFSDQDDIWNEDKIEIMASEMEKNNNILALSGYRTVIDEHDEPATAAYPYPISTNSKLVTKLSFNERRAFLIQSGCVTAFRRAILPHMKELWVEKFSHDILVWRIACILDGAFSIDYPVLKYRVHSSNSSGVSTSNYIGQGTVDKRIAGIRTEYKWTESFLVYFNDCNMESKENKLSILRNGLSFLKKREKFLEKRNLFTWLSLFKEIKFYQSKSKYFGDLMYAYHLNKIGGNVFWKFIKR